LDVGLRIQPERRRDLHRPGEIDDHAVGDIALGEPGVLRARAVDIDTEGRQATRLLNARIGNPRNALDVREQRFGINEVRAYVVTPNLQVDGRGRAEVQDLTDDVGRRERERGSGKTFRQLFAQPANVIRRRRVIFFQCDLDI